MWKILVKNLIGLKPTTLIILGLVATIVTLQFWGVITGWIGDGIDAVQQRFAVQSVTRQANQTIRSLASDRRQSDAYTTLYIEAETEIEKQYDQIVAGIPGVPASDLADRPDSFRQCLLDASLTPDVSATCKPDNP